ncbi:MAG: DUF1848 family protein [Spirochaetes bacterium]|nr:DUF1848 family protein [Spirochaetota bacterium]
MPARILSVSRRTDIPAAYPRWFMECTRRGSVTFPNAHTGALANCSLRPTDVLAFVFWTRNPAPLLPYLDELDGRYGPRHLMHVTVTGLPAAWELRAPDPDTVFRALEALARRYGDDHLTWRFDPILITREHPVDEVIARFRALGQRMKGLVTRCMTSFYDPYARAQGNLAAAGLGELDGRYLSGNSDPAAVALRRELIGGLAAAAQALGIRLSVCCEDDLVGPGLADRGACIDAGLILSVLAGRGILDGGPKTGLAPTRAQCGCSAAIDIGTYDSCPHGCVYCYANRSPASALAHFHAWGKGGFPSDPIAPTAEEA